MYLIVFQFWWYGWLLNYVTVKCFSRNKSATRTYCNPFKPFKESTELMEDFFPEYLHKSFQIEDIALLFDQFSNVRVLHENNFIYNPSIDRSPDCLIVYRQSNRRNPCHYNLFECCNEIWNVNEDFKYRLAYIRALYDVSTSENVFNS